MATTTSLHDLLHQHGFRRTPQTPRPDPSLCRDRRSIDLPSGNPHHHRSRSIGSLTFLSKTTNSASSEDDPTARAVVSALSTYLATYQKDEAFRDRLREKCVLSLAGHDGSAHQLFLNLRLGIEAVERVAERGNSGGEGRKRSLRSSMRLLSAVAAVDSSRSRGQFTCGVPNSHLAACAHLYLSIAYEMERSERAAARHVLQVFCTAPCLARRSLLPDLWELFFLPHLMHLKVWYGKEVEVLSGLGREERDQGMKGLKRVYNDQMDLGTSQFAMYYKGWLKAGGKCPVAPSVTLPPRSSYCSSTDEKLFQLSPTTANHSLYKVVFGHQKKMGKGENGSFDDVGCAKLENEFVLEVENMKHGESAHTDNKVQQRHRTRVMENPIHGSNEASNKSLSFRLFSCRSSADIGNTICNQMPKKEPTSVARETNASVPMINLSRSISVISSSDSLKECETAVRAIARAWLDSQGDPIVETALSSITILEGLVEVMSMSKNSEVLELAMSTLAELVTRNKVNRHVILNADPQLEVLMRLLASHGLFLKAAVLLYLLQPKAKQMLSTDWVPLVLRVLEHGEEGQTLFSVKCSPKSAAFYLLDQLLSGFDEDRNAENARQVVSHGGLRMLIRWLELGDIDERRSAASLLTVCVQADGSCREFLACNIKKKSIIELLVGNQLKSNGCAILLLAELLCLKRRTQITKFLLELKCEGLLNTMHVLLVYLQQAPAEQRPLTAAILLELDLMGDISRYSIYREEAFDFILRALDSTNSKKIQEQCSRALLVLAGRFNSTGESLAESRLLKRAGLYDCPDQYDSEEFTDDRFSKMDGNDITEEWLRRLANVLMKRGNKRFLIALSNCIANGIPTLSRSCLVTVAWMTDSLGLEQSCTDLLSLACSVLIPRLLDSLKYDKALEERVLASFSLFNFTRNADCLSKIMPLNRDSEALLEDLCQFTWTAKEMLLHSENN